MVHITSLKALKDLIALDPEHYWVHLGFPWPEVEDDPKAIENLKLKVIKPPPEDEEGHPFCEDFPPYATLAYSDKKSKDVDHPDDIGVLIATIDPEVYRAWNRGE
ncbi:MAG: hypothetical protein KC643_18590 [Nitrospira sp.]|nr:hypothetical protein [Nitrospira sp.]GJL62077.1 MAG: hypothetical protein NPIRA04_07310 [Nitrospirales bacterium]